MRNAKSLEHSGAPVKTQPSRSADPARRRFLLALGAGGAGAAVATAGALPAAATQQASEPTDQDAAYRESEHVRDYYRTARL
jgi:hypothetical protein